MSVIDGGMQPFALTLDKFLSHAAKWHPQAEVVTARADDTCARIGYAQLMERSMRLSALLKDVGIRCGDRVATLAWNTQAHVEVSYAIMGIGAICHTLNPRLLGAQLAAMLSLSEARVLIVSTDLTPLAREIVDGTPLLERVFVIDALPGADLGPVGNMTFSELEPLLPAASVGVTWGDFAETLPSGLCFTSGTTGGPKGVTYTHRSSYLHTLRLLQADVMAISAADSVLAVVPMFHANAWGLPYAVPAVGAKLVLPGRNTDGARLARLIAAEEVSLAVGVPTVWLGLVEHLEANGGELPSLTAHRGRRRAFGACADGAHRASLGRDRADQLGHDRAVAVRHRGITDDACALGDHVGAAGGGSRSFAHRRLRSSTTATARRRGTFARTRRRRTRALFRRVATRDRRRWLARNG